MSRLFTRFPLAEVARSQETELDSARSNVLMALLKRGPRKVAELRAAGFRRGVLRAAIGELRSAGYKVTISKPGHRRAPS
jgi:hypothetical protein